MAWELHSIVSINAELADKRAAKQQCSHALCTTAWVYVTIDSTVYKVSRATQQITATIQFGYTIDAVSSNEAWIILGTRDGVIHFLSVDLDKVILSQTAVLPHSEDVPLQQLRCSSLKEDRCSLAVLSNSNWAIILPDIQLNLLDKTLQEEEVLEMLKMVATVKIDLRTCHGSEIPCSVCFQDDNIISTGKICGIQLWEMENNDYMLSDTSLWILEDVGVRKCEASSDGELLLVISEDRCLVVLQLLAGMMVVTNIWDRTPVQDFVVCCSSFNQSDQKACVLTAQLDQKQAVLCLVSLPGLVVVHSIDVSPTAALCYGVMSEDCLLFTDLSISNGQAHLQVNQLMLSRGEDKLKRLIQQRKFMEAEVYALNNELSVEVVYKAHAEFLMDIVCNNKTTDHDGEANHLLECLKKIKDAEFVCDLCMTSPMMSYDVTQTVLQHCYQVSSHDGELHKKISVLLHKLTLFQLIYGERAFSVVSWLSFLDTTVVDNVKASLQLGDFSKAAYIWTASAGELIECVGTEVMVDILKAIPETGTSQELTSWIKDIILPFILSQLPLMVKDFLSWAENIVYSLEENEKDNWPVNSYSLATAIQTLLLNHKSDMLVGGNALYKLWDDLVRQLEDLRYLHKELKFPVSLAHHSKVTREELVYQLLDRVTVSELVSSVVDSQIRPYCARHKLNVDTVLLHYVKKPVNQMKSSSEFALERKIVALLNAISDQQHQVDGCMELVTQYCTSHWSDDMEQLVTTCLTLCCNGVEELASHYKWMRLKRVLLEYGITDTFSAHASWNLVKLIRFILKKPNSLQDALQVAEHYQFPESDVYFYHVQNLFLAEEFSAGWEVLCSLNTEIGCVVATNIFTKSLEYSTLFNGTSSRAGHVKAITTCILCLQYLKGNATSEQLDTLLVYVDQWGCDVDGLLRQLRCLQILAEKYSVCLSLKGLNDKSYCTELLDELIEQHHTSTLSLTPQKSEETVSGNFCSSFSGLVSVCGLLGFCETEVYRRLLKKLCEVAINVDQQKVARILDVLGDTPDKETTTVLKQCMTEVWKVTSATTRLSLDQQQKLLELLDIISTKAITVSPTGQLMECMELWRVLRLCIITGKQCKDDVSFSTIEFQPQEDHTCYDLWCWPRRYLETGMILDYALIMPLVMSNALSVFNTRTDNPSAVLSLCKPLANNGFHQLALDWALMTYHNYLKQEMSTMAGGLSKSHTSPQKLKECSHAIKGLLKEILSKVLSAKRLEHFYGLSLLLSNHPQVSRKQLSLEGMHRQMDTSHLAAIQGVCQLAICYGCITGDCEVTRLARDYYRHASWGRRLEQYKVSMVTGEKSAVVKVLGAMMKESAIPVTMILQYCKDYCLDQDEMLGRYMAVVLGEWPRGYQSVIQEVVGLLGTTEWIEKFFCDALEKANPYDYDRIGFLLEQLKSLGSEEWSPTENLLLLNRLKQYSRVSTPSQCELQFYHEHISYLIDTGNSLIMSDQQLPSQSKQYLPFHALLETTTAESIISAELYPHTIKVLLPIAEELQISSETCCGLAIKNEFAARQGGGVSVDSVIELISKIDDFSVAISAAKWSAKQFSQPKDADKRAKVLQKAQVLAKNQASSLSCTKEKEKVLIVLQQLTVAYQSTMVEQLLMEYNIALPRYIQQAEYIGVLISYLYTDAPELGDVPVHEVVSKLLALKPQLNFQKILHKLLDTWLHSRGASPALSVDQDITQHNISLAPVDAHENTSEEDEVRLKRLSYLLGDHNHLEQSVKHLLSLLKADSSVVTINTKVIVYKMLFAITPKRLLEKLSNTSTEALNSQHQVLLFLCELQRLHIHLTVEEFQAMKKIGVIYQLLKNHSHEPQAMWLVAEMCQHFSITDVQPWTALLKQMHTLGMMVHIRKLLLCLSSKLGLSLVTVLAPFWEAIIMYPFKHGVSPDDQPSECEISIKLLLKISIPSSSEIMEHFVSSLWAVGQRVEALFCCGSLTALKQKTISDLLSDLSSTDCVSLLDKAASSCLLYSKPVAELIYNFIDSGCRYTLIFGTPYFQKLVVYLVEKDQLEHLLVTTLKAKRLPEAIQLVEMYYQDKNITGTEALREYISTHDLEMAVTEL